MARATHAQTSGANGTHDPSRIIESEGRYYFFGTGGGGASSPDGFVWTGSTGPFAGGIPAEVTTAAGSPNGGIWAPDIIFLNGQYYLYYAVANTDPALSIKTKPTAIGLLTSPTLNPKSADYKWTDRGIVLTSGNPTTHTPSDYSTIDPAPGFDAQGNLWLSWGSGYGKGSVPTIYITRLDNATGLVSKDDPVTPGHALGPMGAVEGSYFYYKDGYYYLFWNSGGCCNGAKSTYEIHVARAQTILGPYTENSQMFYQSNGSIHGPGQIGIYDKCGYSRFTYHYYPDSGFSVLGMNELSFANGWPVAGPVSTTPLKPCGDYGGDAGAGTSSPVAASDAAARDDATVSMDAGALNEDPDTGATSGGPAAPGDGANPGTSEAGASGSGSTAPTGGGGAATSGVSQIGAGGSQAPSAGSSTGKAPGASDDGAVQIRSSEPDVSGSSGGCSLDAGPRSATARSTGGLLVLFGLVLRAGRGKRSGCRGRRYRCGNMFFRNLGEDAPPFTSLGKARFEWRARKRPRPSSR